MAATREQRTLDLIRRTLTTLGVETRFMARGDALKGVLELGGEHSLKNPVGGEPVRHIAFTVRGSGQMHLDDPPPLRGICVDDCSRVYSLEGLLDSIRTAFLARAARLRDVDDRFQTLGVDTRTDGERFVVIARVDLDPLGVAILEGDEEGVVARQLVPVIGNRSPLAFRDLEIDLSDFQDRTDLELFLSAHAEALVAQSSQRGNASATSPGHDPANVGADADRQLVAGLLPPIRNEVWVMDVRVEADDGHEVRYCGVNIGGAAFGAPRILPKPAFEAAYVPVAQGYRMLVQVVDVSENTVTYLRLDAERAPVGTPRSCPLVVFLANFTPEAAAY